MNTLIYVAIKDLAVGAFMTASPQQSTGAAVRSFTDMMNDPQSDVSRHPEDYELWQLSQWHSGTGHFCAGCEEGDCGEVFVPVLLVRGKDVVRPKS